MEEQKKYTKCPLCNVEGEALDKHKLVWYHSFLDRKGAPASHKWSVKTGRMFVQKASDDDSLW